MNDAARRSDWPHAGVEAALALAVAVLAAALAGRAAPRAAGAATTSWIDRAEAIRRQALAGEWELADRDAHAWERAAGRSGGILERARAAAASARLALERNSFHRRDPKRTARVLARAYALAVASGDLELRAIAIHGMGRQAYWKRLDGEGDWTDVTARLDSARVLREGLPGRPGLAETLFYLGLVQQMNERDAEAGDWFTRAQVEVQRTGDALEASNLTRHQGYLIQRTGDRAAARTNYEASLRLREGAGAMVMVPFALTLLADAELEAGGDTTAAIARLEEAMRVARRARSRRAEASAAQDLAAVLAARGRPAEARAALKRAVEESLAYGDAAAAGRARRLLAQLGTPR